MMLSISLPAFFTSSMGMLSIPGALLHESSQIARSVSARVGSGSSVNSSSVKSLDIFSSLLYKRCVYCFHLSCISFPSVSTLPSWSFTVAMRGVNFPVICLIAWNTFLDFPFA